MNDLPLNSLDYYGEKLSAIGKGSYGTVYKCKGMDNTCVAVKTFRKIDELTSDTLREIAILNRYRHPNIVRLIDVSMDVNSVNMIMDLYHSSLSGYMSNIIEPNIKS